MSRNSHTVGFDAKFYHLFILLLACRSTVTLDNPTDAPAAKVRHTGMVLIVALTCQVDGS